MAERKQQTAKELLASRKAAYMAVFDPGGARLPEVMADLEKFCRAAQSTFHPDSRTHALMEGRREVYLRIHDHLTLTVDQLLPLYGGTDG